MTKNKFPPCPKCGRKGLHYADHPHAWGWKDYDRAKCRFCGATFKLINKKEEELQNVSSQALV